MAHPKVMGRYPLSKPPLLTRLAGLSLKLFGTSLFALRLPAFAAAIFCTVIVFSLACRAGSLRWAGRPQYCFYRTACGTFLRAYPMPICYSLHASPVLLRSSTGTQCSNVDLMGIRCVMRRWSDGQEHRGLPSAKRQEISFGAISFPGDDCESKAAADGLVTLFDWNPTAVPEDCFAVYCYKDRERFGWARGSFFRYLEADFFHAHQTGRITRIEEWHPPVMDAYRNGMHDCAGRRGPRLARHHGWIYRSQPRSQKSERFTPPCRMLEVDKTAIRAQDNRLASRVGSSDFQDARRHGKNYDFYDCRSFSDLNR
jgi:hypothetical protein